MLFEVPTVEFRELSGRQNERVFRILAVGVPVKIKTSRHYGFTVDENHFVVCRSVPGVNSHGDSSVRDASRFGIGFSPIFFVKTPLTRTPRSLARMSAFARRLFEK